MRVTDFSFEPVSYNNFRTHETLFTLVCRFLLEKKKKKHKTLLRDHPPVAKTAPKKHKTTHT
ncbi:hypothetical protein, partial [Salmonella enterica]|uniref:hypothetical protein n=1 Tax=Salmonella enterica TaxID=28901 RepID=UPI001C630AF8